MLDLSTMKVRMEKVKILFLCSRFGGGGAEMHLLRVLTYTDFSKFDIHLALTRDGGNYEQSLPEQVKIYYLTKNINSSVKALLISYSPLKKLISELKPASVVSFMDPQNLLLAFVKKTSAKSFPKVIFACQNAPVKSLANDGMTGKLFLRFVPGWYKKYPDKIIAICEGVQKEIRETLGVTKPIKVIYNAGFDESYKIKVTEALQEGVVKADIQLVACGRLTKQKGFDVLIDAIKLLEDIPGLGLWILGTGEDKEKLTAQSIALGLQDRVQFLGFQSNPYQFFGNADVFVLSSRWEGFGNVITEAMICGCVVAATDCDYGPNEIITDKLNGLLCKVEDPISLAESIRYLIENKAAKKAIADNGFIRAQDFTSAEISRQYFDEITKTINI